MADTPTASATVKTWFETGDVPTQQQFADFITSYSNLIDNNWLDNFTSGITAHAGGGQGSAVALTTRDNFISTVASNNDSTKLAAAVVGRFQRVYNSGANGCAVFPQSGESIAQLGANTAINVKPGWTLIIFCVAAGTWQYQLIGAQGARPAITFIQSSASALTPDISLYTDFLFTALSSNLTINAPSAFNGSGDEFCMLLVDNNTPRTLTWNVSFKALYSALPTTTIAGAYMFFRFKLNAQTGYWYLIDYAVEGFYTAPKKTYRALISQAGTAAPTAVVLENSLGGTPSFSRTSAGLYVLTATGLINSAKTFARIASVDGSQNLFAIYTLSSPDTLNIKSTNLTGIATDALLTSTAVEIFVYP